MMLNVGCGEHYARGWTNVDSTPGHCIRGVDVVADVVSLPFDDGVAERIYAGHVFEHVPVEMLPVVCAELGRVLAADGELAVVGPDVYRMIEWWHEGRAPWSLVVSGLEGPDDHTVAWERLVPGGHAWNCTGDRVVTLLGDHGFKAEKVELPVLVAAGWPVIGVDDWQFGVLARG